ncbi:MAG: YdcF family protein [Xanthomonadaceae bacterium]|nr:YdcF family protein [Xanthomonadaceae bacterium]
MISLYSPLTLAILASLLALVAARFCRRVLLSAALLLVVLFLGLATPLGANLLVRAVETQTPVERRAMLEACPEAASLVFLSGGMRRPARDPDDFGALTTETLDRVLTLQAHKPPKDLPLVVSGGGPFRVGEAEIIAALMERLDIGSPDLRTETRSTSTRTSAFEVARLLGSAEHRIILATSALHLPRATWTFRKAGFEVCPWPLNSRYVAVRGPAGLWPQSTALEKSERALYELLGQIYYRLNRKQNLREHGSLLRKPGGPEPVGACPAGDCPGPGKIFASTARSYENQEAPNP